MGVYVSKKFFPQRSSWDEIWILEAPLNSLVFLQGFQPTIQRGALQAKQFGRFTDIAMRQFKCRINIKTFLLQ